MLAKSWCPSHSGMPTPFNFTFSCDPQVEPSLSRPFLSFQASGLAADVSLSSLLLCLLPLPLSVHWGPWWWTHAIPLQDASGKQIPNSNLYEIHNQVITQLMVRIMQVQAHNCTRLYVRCSHGANTTSTMCTCTGITFMAQHRLTRTSGADGFKSLLQGKAGAMQFVPTQEVHIFNFKRGSWTIRLRGMVR